MTQMFMIFQINNFGADDPVRSNHRRMGRTEFAPFADKQIV